MSYEQCVSRALALPATPSGASAEVVALRAKLQARLDEFEGASIASHSVEGESITRQPIAVLGQRVCTYLSAYLQALANEDLGQRPVVPRIGHGFDFSTREVRA